MATFSEASSDEPSRRRVEENAEGNFWEELYALFPEDSSRQTWLQSHNMRLGGDTPQNYIDAHSWTRLLDVVRSMHYVGMS